MKPATVFLDELTNREIEQFLTQHHTVVIPVGATEQHGPHSAVGTDVFIPREVARRIAEQQKNLLVAPSIPYTLSYPHRGFVTEFSLRIETFMAMIRDLAISFAQSGFKRVVFLNGHYDNTHALAYACAQAISEMPDDARAYSINHWDTLTPEQFEEFGAHAGLGEVSMMMAINPAYVDNEQLNCEHPNFPKSKTNSPAIHSAFFFSNPGSVYQITESGTWGDATGATPELGEKFLARATDAVIDLMDDIEKSFEQLPLRPRKGDLKA
ncbi:creatininase family protein [Calycomorphotria hydatis]|uniref:Creatinine amidohydrolase n=1 Tax=Calycomorphotria hydatis TaxID=2528027 RepID=A0A517T6Q3_9PLAN|nr:creatininase family protein [Calycomorphotria hydatis]QDT64051.1 Creatinine amidohydrolase [Calycomorphotria hydatis]